MKRLLTTLISILTVAIATAQLPNNSFETWENDTAIVGFGLFPNDTVVFQDPEGWTSINGLSGADTLGGFMLVSQTADAYHGTFAIMCETKKLDTIIVSPLPPLALTIPGLILNGNFAFNPASIITGGVITPMSITTAGSPVAGRQEKIFGHYKYIPATNDTMIVWAVLKKNGVMVAEAKFTSTDTAMNYTYFEAPFQYNSCLIPDTIVMLISSSVPDLGSLLAGGNTNIVPGSVLTVDSVGSSPMPGNATYPIVAHPDYDTIVVNSTAIIDVALNDANCDNDPLTHTIFTLPSNGTATIAGSVVTYTPANNFIGLDSLRYEVSDGSTTDQAWVFILNLPVGINENTAGELFVYPNPAKDVITIRTAGTFDFVAELTGMNGQVMEVLEGSHSASFRTSSLPNGLYTIRITDKQTGYSSVSKVQILR